MVLQAAQTWAAIHTTPAVSRDARTWAAIHTTPAVLQAAHRPASTAMEETVAAIINPVTEAAIIEARMPLR